MFVAGIDAHATYSVIAIVSNTGQLVQAPVRIKNTEEDRLNELFEKYRPLEVVVETSPAWPWLFDRLEGNGIHFVLAHAKRLRVIAESNYKSDDIDAELLARMRLAGLIPEVHPKCIEQREQAVLLRNRARLVRERTRMVNRILVRAVVSHVTYAPDSWLSQSYERIRQRLGWQVARVATARRLARAVHAMLRTGEVWHDQPVTQQN
jgi:transposase